MGRLLKANAVALLVLALLVIIYYFPYTPYGISTSNPTSRQGEDIRTTLNRLINAVLSKINEERRKFGVPPVNLLNDTVTRFRAEDMYGNEYFGHCDLSGMAPNYHYTRLGGSYVIEENLGYYYIVGRRISPTDNAVKSVEKMIYDDAESDWGHRDSILDPTNNFVSVYALWDDSRLFLVIHMMKIWVEWITPPVIREKAFIAEGRILLNGSKLHSVLIYYSSPNTSRIFNSRLNVLETCSSYSVGELIAVVVPEPYYYAGIKTIRPLKWLISNQYFRIEFPVNLIRGREGLYTIVLYVENTLQITHPFNKERYRNYLPILKYTFLMKSN